MLVQSGEAKSRTRTLESGGPNQAPGASFIGCVFGHVTKTLYNLGLITVATSWCCLGDWLSNMWKCLE